MDDMSVQVKLICRVCGNDQFSFDFAGDDFCDAPGEASVTCAYCGYETTKEELIEDNARGVDAGVEELTEMVVEEFQKEIDKAIKKAFR